MDIIEYLAENSYDIELLYSLLLKLQNSYNKIYITCADFEMVVIRKLYHLLNKIFNDKYIKNYYSYIYIDKYIISNVMHPSRKQTFTLRSSKFTLNIFMHNSYVFYDYTNIFTKAIKIINNIHQPNNTKNDNNIKLIDNDNTYILFLREHYVLNYKIYDLNILTYKMILLRLIMCSRRKYLSKYILPEELFKYIYENFMSL